MRAFECSQFHFGHIVFPLKLQTIEMHMETERQWKA